MIADAMTEEEIVNIGLVDVDFAANLGEGDEILFRKVCLNAITKKDQLYFKITIFSSNNVTMENKY